MLSKLSLLRWLSVFWFPGSVMCCCLVGWRMSLFFLSSLCISFSMIQFVSSFACEIWNLKQMRIFLSIVSYIKMINGLNEEDDGGHLHLTQCAQATQHATTITVLSHFVFLFCQCCIFFPPFVLRKCSTVIRFSWLTDDLAIAPSASTSVSGRNVLFVIFYSKKLQLQQQR